MNHDQFPAATTDTAARSPTGATQAGEYDQMPHHSPHELKRLLLDDLFDSHGNWIGDP